MNKINLKHFATKLDSIKIGKIGINKATTIDGNQKHSWLTLYSINNRCDEFDEQLTFKPDELISFCREIIRVAEEQSYNRKCTKRFSLCLDCENKNKCKRYSNHRKEVK